MADQESMMARSKPTKKTFLLISTEASTSLAGAITQALLEQGYEKRGICEDPRIIIILDLEENIQLQPKSERSSMVWLREMVINLEYGGSAIAFCPKHLSEDQLKLLKIENFELDHAAQTMFFSFDTAAEFLEKFSELPEDFNARAEEE